MHLPPPISVPMPPQEQAKGRDSIMNLAVLLLGSIPAARIMGSMVTIPMAQAAASCITLEAHPSPMAMINVNRVTLLPAFLMIKYPSRLVKPASSRAMAKIRQHMMKITTGCMYGAQASLGLVIPMTTRNTPMHMAVISRGIGSTTNRKISTTRTARNRLAVGDNPST